MEVHQPTTWWDVLMASREPDFVIHTDDGGVYLRRWWLVPRNDLRNVYLHEALVDDQDYALHDHRGPNTSYILEGAYREHMESGVYERPAGTVVHREAEELHRLELMTPRVVSLFLVGPCTRDWGFLVDGEWVCWRDFHKQNPDSRLGANSDGT